jgi:hypothetical protein
MTPGKATLAILVDDQRRPVEVAVMAASKIIAKVAIKDVLAIVAQLEKLERTDEDEHGE